MVWIFFFFPGNCQCHLGQMAPPTPISMGGEWGWGFKSSLVHEYPTKKKKDKILEIVIRFWHFKLCWNLLNLSWSWQFLSLSTSQCQIWTPPPPTPPTNTQTQKGKKEKREKGLIACPFAVRKSAPGSEFSWNQLFCRSIFKWAQKGHAKGDVLKAFSRCHWYFASWWSKLACCSCSSTRSSWENSP